LAGCTPDPKLDPAVRSKFKTLAMGVSNKSRLKQKF